MTAHDIANALGVKTNTVYVWRKRGKIPEDFASLSTVDAPKRRRLGPNPYPKGVDPNVFMSAKDTAKEWGVCRETIFSLINKGKIPEAMKYGNQWFIPRDTPKPDWLKPRPIQGFPAEVNPKDYITVKEAGEMLGVQPATVKMWIYRNYITDCFLAYGTWHVRKDIEYPARKKRTPKNNG